MKRLLIVALAAAGLLGVSPRQADASLIFTMQEVGSDVVVTGSGTIDLTGLTALAGGPFPRTLICYRTGFLRLVRHQS